MDVTLVVRRGKLSGFRHIIAWDGIGERGIVIKDGLHEGWIVSVGERKRHDSGKLLALRELKEIN